jgi:hypothetical protein
MTDIDFQIRQFIADVPGNFPKRISSILEQNDKEYYERLYLLRLEFEKFIDHLAVLTNSEEEEWQKLSSVKNKIQFLAGSKVNLLQEGIEHYLLFWYGIGCIGSHQKSITEEKYVSLKHHFEMGVKSMLTVFYWYLKEFPPLRGCLKSVLMEYWQD